MKLETFFNKFDELADSPDAMAKIRQLVLDLALNGSVIGLDASKWDRVSLGSLGEWGSGGTPLRSEPQYYGGSIPWLVIGDLNDGVVTSASSTITEEGLANSSARLLPKGVLLIAMYGSIGKMGITGIECATNQAIAFCKPDPKRTDLRYLFHALKGIQPALLARGQGLAQKNISQTILKAWEINLPPLAEQKRIVAKVDELMALCDRLEAQQQERETRHAALARASLARFADAPTPANLPFLFHPSYAIPPADLRKSILTLAVQGKLVPQDVEPPFGTLESILAEASVNGVSKGPTFDKSATEILRISAGTSRGDFYVNEDDFKHVDLPPGEIDKFQLAPGDLLACRFNGNLHYVGRFSYYRGESGRVQVNPDKLIRFRIKTESHCPRYVCLAMNAAPTREAIEGMCATTAGNIGLSAGRLKTVEIPLPPLAEQRRIVEKVEQLMALVDALETQLAASRATAANLLSALVADLTTRE